jgi:phosphopantetheinyl transferase
MTTDAVAAGMTPYRPSPPFTSPRDPCTAGPGGAAVEGWGTPSCAADLASWFGAAAAAVTPPCGSGDDIGRDRYLSERQPGGWTCVTERWSTAADRSGVVDRYLAGCERAVYDRLAAAVRPGWLLGRVAAKDAVRWWLADRGRTVEPAEVVLANERSGRPVINAIAAPAPGPTPGSRSGTGRGAAPGAFDLRISIAHVAGTGVAIVTQGQDVGIDVEETAPRPRSFARVAFSARERDERARATSRPACRPAPADAHAAMDEPTWMAASWCAKEAAAKAAGTGLQGRPTRFVTRLVAPDLFTVGARLVRCTRLDPVRYCSHAGHSLVVGWTLSVDRGPGLESDLDLDLDLDRRSAPGGRSGALAVGDPRW